VRTSSEAPQVDAMVLEFNTGKWVGRRQALVAVRRVMALYHDPLVRRALREVAEEIGKGDPARSVVEEEDEL
jgi:hypothetical protein